MTPSLAWRRAALSAASLLCALIAGEVVARAVFPEPPDPARQPQIVYQYDRELRYVYLPNQKGWIDDGFVTINSFGFRGSEVAVPKPGGRFRIVVLGDSLTVGWGVGDGDTYCAQLERLLREKYPDRDLDVVNLGVSGYNTRQEVGLLERYLSRLDPDMVLVGFYTNDVPDSLEDIGPAAPNGTQILAAAPKAGQILRMHDPATQWETPLRKSRAVYLLGRVAKRWTGNGEWATAHYSMELDVLEGKQSALLDRAWTRVEEQFARLQSLSAAHHFSVGLVVLPCLEQAMGQFPNERYQSTIRALAQKFGFIDVDPLPSLKASRGRKDALFVPYDRNHPSAEGHRIIARSITDAIERQGTLQTAAERTDRGGS
jgi:lysophospholipase L1-like esterase